MKSSLSTASGDTAVSLFRRTGFGWLRRTFALIVVAAFLSASLFGALHLIIHHSPHQQNHCSFCKYFNDSQAETISPVVASIQLWIADAYPYPILHSGHISVILSQDPRAPPAAIC